MTSHAVEDVKQGQHFCIAGESSNVYNYSRNQFGSFTENKEYFYLKIQLYHSQAYTQEMSHHTTRNFFTIFLAALFITDRNSKQPRCPSIEKWIKKIWFIYTMEYHSAMKKRASWNMQANGWNLKISSWVRQPRLRKTIMACANIQLIGYYL